MPALIPGVTLPVKLNRKVTANLSAIPAGQFSVETVTVTGLKVGDFVLVNAPNLETGVKVISARVSAADTLELTLVNLTSGSVNPASQVFFVVAL